MTGFPITFLAPTAGLIAASVATPLLLLFYFLKLRRRPVRVSSTLLWFDAAHDLQANTPFRWLRVSWLLFLQLALLLCLIVAFARPAIDAPRSDSDRVILLLDCSASMNAKDGAGQAGGAGRASVGERSRLDEAKDRAIELVDRLSDRTQVLVIAFAAQARTEINFTRDRAAVRRAIRDVRPSDQPADLAAAMRVVQAFVASGSEDESGTAPRVVLLSDGGATERPGEAPAAVGNVAFEFVRVGPAPDAARDNAGIVALAARREIENPSSVRVFVRMENTLDRDVEGALTCRLDGAVVEVAAIRIPGASENSPGQSARTFTMDAPRGGLIVLSWSRNDLLETDNTAALVLAPPGAPRIVLVQPNAPSDTLDYLPLDALTTLEPRELRSITSAEYERLAAGGEWAGFDLVVFDRVRPSTLPPIPSISFGAALPIAGLTVAPFEPEDPAGAPTRFAFWLRAHPVMRYANLANVPVRTPLRLVLPPDDARAGGRPIRSEVLASGGSGPLLAQIDTGGVQRILVAFELGESLWWRDPSFPIFMRNAVETLTLRGDDSTARLFTTALPVSVRPAPGASEVRVSGPIDLVRQVPPDAATVPLGVLDRVGVYRVSGAAPGEDLLTVNLLNPRESAVRTEQAVRIAGRSASAGTLATAAPREVWHWFVLAALALLCIEWTLFAWRSRV